MRILLDCDGVMSDFVGATLRYLNLQLGYGLKYEDVTSYDMLRDLPLHDKDRKKLETYWTTTDIHTDTKPLVSAAWGYTQLVSAGHDVRVLTAPLYSSRGWMAERVYWLGHHIGVPAKHIIFASHEEKPYIEGDVLVDDRTDTVEVWASVRPTGLAVLFQQPWSTEPHEDSQIYTVDNWTQLVEALRVDHTATHISN